MPSSSSARIVEELSAVWHNCPVPVHRTIPFLLLLIYSGCADSPTPVQPSGPSAAGPPIERLAIQVAVKVDDSASREAVAAVSGISVEASAAGTSGTVTYSIDFGDGTTASGGSARHTYSAPGSFTIRADARDESGRTGTASQELVVTTVSGTLAHAGFNARTGKMEVRSLVLGSQEGSTLRGVYRTSGSPDRAFVGTLSAPRTVRITLEGTTEAAEGTLPDRVSDDRGLWPLLMRGDSVDGTRLDFRRAAGNPTGSAPDAVAVVEFGAVGAMPIVDVTSVIFDATQSRGTDLSYFFEFGDGEKGTGSRLTRQLHRIGNLKAFLTVVDRFGRSDTESVSYWCMGLRTFPFDAWRGLLNGGHVWLDLTSRDGANYGGVANYNPSGPENMIAPFFATLSDENHVYIAIPALGVEFRGTIVTDRLFNHRMTLVQSGGTSNGVTWTLGYDDGPG